MEPVSKRNTVENIWIFSSYIQTYSTFILEYNICHQNSSKPYKTLSKEADIYSYNTILLICNNYGTTNTKILKISMENCCCLQHHYYIWSIKFIQKNFWMNKRDNVETRGTKTEGLWHAYNGHYKTAIMEQAEMTSNRKTAMKFGVDVSHGHHTDCLYKRQTVNSSAHTEPSEGLNMTGNQKSKNICFLLWEKKKWWYAYQSRIRLVKDTGNYQLFGFTSLWV
jgi:hypothetical protein